jgi:hypothetical protein
MWLLVFERIILDFIFHLLYFPVWWYTGGVVHTARFFARQVRFVHAYLVPDLWLKNLFVPMFGQYDWQGRIMSFFIRLANVVVRTLMLIFWIIFMLAVCIIWPLVPVAVGYMIVRS